MCQTVRGISVVRQKQQTFGVRIEPADVEEPLPAIGDEVAWVARPSGSDSVETTPRGLFSTEIRSGGRADRDPSTRITSRSGWTRTALLGDQVPLTSTRPSLIITSQAPPGSHPSRSQYLLQPYASQSTPNCQESIVEPARPAHRQARWLMSSELSRSRKLSKFVSSSLTSGRCGLAPAVRRGCAIPSVPGSTRVAKTTAPDSASCPASVIRPRATKCGSPRRR